MSTFAVQNDFHKNDYIRLTAETLKMENPDVTSGFFCAPIVSFFCLFSCIFLENRIFATKIGQYCCFVT